MNITKSLLVIFSVFDKYILIFSFVVVVFFVFICVVFTFCIISSMSFMFFFFVFFFLEEYETCSIVIGISSLSFNALNKLCLLAASTLFLTTTPELVTALYVYVGIFAPPYF